MAQLVCLFLSRASLCSPGWLRTVICLPQLPSAGVKDGLPFRFAFLGTPGTHYIAQLGLELTTIFLLQPSKCQDIDLLSSSSKFFNKKWRTGVFRLPGLSA